MDGLINIKESYKSKSKSFNHFLHKRKEFTIGTIQDIALIFFIFCLNFERWDPLNLEIDYLVIKIAFAIYLFAIFLSPLNYFKLDYFKRYFYPIFLFFSLYTLISYININNYYTKFFDSLLFFNLITFIFISNHIRWRPSIVSKCFLAYILGSFFISVFYFLNIYVEVDSGGRVSVLGENQNSLGINLVIASSMLIALVFEKRLNLGAVRINLILLLPFLIILIAQTGSRLAALSLFLCILVYIILWDSKKLKQKILVLLSGIIVTAILVVFFLSNSVITDRINNSISSGEIGSRDLLWVTILPLINDNLFFGVGVTGYGGKIISVFDDFTSPHNGIIESLCYTGLIGTFIFIVFLFRVFKKAFSRRILSGEIIYIIFFIPILGVLLSAQIFQQKIIWVLFAFIISEYENNRLTKNTSLIDH